MKTLQCIAWTWAMLSASLLAAETPPHHDAHDDHQHAAKAPAHADAAHQAHGDGAGSSPSASKASAAMHDDPVAELLAEVTRLDARVSLIASEHADGVERQRLWQAARAALVTALDDGSRYVPRDEVAAATLSTCSQREGLGFDWNPLSRIITRVVADSPAAVGGLRPGQRIVRIAGDPGTQTAQVVRALSAEQVQIELAEGDGSAARTVLLRRGLLADPGVDAVLDVAPGIGLLRVHRFCAPPASREVPGTAQAMAAALMPMRWRGLILDLRGCSGEVAEGVAACAAFLPAGEAVTVATSHGRSAASQRVHSVSGSGRALMPLVVLVDARTAEAGEMLAQALRIQRRARVIGATTAGVATLRKWYVMPEGDAYQLTVARLRDSRGQSWEHGVIPDAVLHDDEAQRVAGIIAGATRAAAVDAWIGSALRELRQHSAGK